MVGSGGAERRITGGPPWGLRRNVRFISIAATEDCAPLISYGSTVAPEEVPTINLP